MVEAIISVLLLVLTFCGALLVIVAETVPDQSIAKRTRRKLIIGGGVLAAICTLGGAILAARVQSKLETLAGETKDLVTGGNSYVWLRIFPAATDPSQLRAYVVHTGDDVPSFDVRIRIEPTGQCDDVEQWTWGRVMSTGVNNPRDLYIPAVTSTTLRNLEVNLVPSCDDPYYLAIISTRNRTVLSQAVLHREDGRWHEANRVVDLTSGDVLISRVPTTYPGTVTWPDIEPLRQRFSEAIGSLDQE